LEITHYIDHMHAIGRAGATIASYHRDLQRLAALMNDPEPAAVNPEALEKVVLFLARPENGMKRGYDVSTLNRIKSTYRSFFGWLCRTGRIGFNPAAELLFVRNASRPTLPMSLGQARALLDTIRRSSSPYSTRDEALFAVYAYTGLRRNEALSLRIGDYHADTQSLTVVRSKREGICIVPVPPVLAGVLNRHIQELKNEDAFEADLFLFHGQDHQHPLCARQVQARFAKWKKMAGLNSCLRLHSFRAGYATLLYHHTGDLLMVSALLGHRSLDATRRYIHSGGPDVRDRLAQVFG
jgi:site-specific recombinase XerC